MRGEVLPTEIEQILADFTATYKKIDMSLERLQIFLAEIGNPQNQLPPTIHVAGTNGKGSTIAFLRAMLEAAGKTCHVYTSPHLVRFNERIMLAGEQISDANLLPILQEVAEKSASHPLTFFEKTTAAAFVAFARHPADFLLLETGMGGRLDATNLAENKLLSIITPISYDHTEFLGNTLPEIAAEKAGIMRTNIPTILAQQSAEVAAYFAKLHDFEIIHAQPEKFAELGLVGDFQHINAATAKAGAKLLALPEAAILAGLTTATWPARLQKIAVGNLRNLLPQNCELWLDGGHNQAGAEAIAQSIAPDFLVLGMLNNKNLESFLQNFTHIQPKIFAVNINNCPDARSAEEIIQIATKLGFECGAFQSVEQALAEIAIHAKFDDITLICGSLYLAGEFLQKN